MTLSRTDFRGCWTFRRGGGDEFEFNGVKIRTRRRWYNIDNVYIRGISKYRFRKRHFHPFKWIPPSPPKHFLRIIRIIRSNFRDFFHRSLFLRINFFEGMEKIKNVTRFSLFNFLIFFFFFSRSHSTLKSFEISRWIYLEEGNYRSREIGKNSGQCADVIVIVCDRPIMKTGRFMSPMP